MNTASLWLQWICQHVSEIEVTQILEGTYESSVEGRQSTRWSGNFTRPLDWWVIICQAKFSYAKPLIFHSVHSKCPVIRVILAFLSRTPAHSLCESRPALAERITIRGWFIQWYLLGPSSRVMHNSLAPTEVPVRRLMRPCFRHDIYRHDRRGGHCMSWLDNHSHLAAEGWTVIPYGKQKSP